MLLRYIRSVLILLGSAALLSWIANAYILVKAGPYIYHSMESVPEVRAVIVPGASVYRSGKLSPVLKQRVELGIQFLETRDSAIILFSGHTIPDGYNEPAAMAEFARKRKVPSGRIYQDSGGTSTYISLMNCRTRFLDEPLLIVSQDYHLPRALYIAREIGLNAFGLAVSVSGQKEQAPLPVREFFSRLKDFCLLNFYKLFQTGSGHAEV